MSQIPGEFHVPYTGAQAQDLASFTAQSSTLFTMQRRHGVYLQESGVVGEALVHTSPDQSAAISRSRGLARPVVYARTADDRPGVLSGSSVVGVAIKLPDGQSIEVPVAQTYDGITTPYEGFDGDHADVVIKAAHELANLKKSRVPDLSFDLTTVTDLTRPAWRPHEL